MKKKKINIIFDASVLAFNFQKNSTRSGIFFTAYNILKEFLERPEVNLYLYVAPERYAEELLLNRNYFPQANYLHDFSSYPKAAIAKVCNYLWKLHEKNYNRVHVRKVISLGILACQFVFKRTVKLKHSDNVLKNADFYFSPIYKVPKFIRKYKNIKPIVFLHDAIPLLPIYETSVSKYNAKSHRSLIDSFAQEDLFFANSTQTLEDFKRLTDKIDGFNSVVIPLAASNGFCRVRDVAKLQKVEEKYRIPRGKKYVFSLCSLEPRKNLIRAVNAFIQFIERNEITDLIWVMGGGTWDAFVNELKRQNKSWRPNLIIRAGYVDDEDLPILYSNAEWFVYTSQYEGFGLPPLEAMQCGCPVITSNNSSLPEVIGSAGIMIDWDSDEQHIAAYEKLYFDESLRIELREKGLSRAKNFSWKKSVDKMLSTMKSQIAEQNEKLNIIYRMCDTVSASSVNKRCFNVSKNQLIKKCLESLRKNFETYSKSISLYCVADNCSADIVDFIKKLFPKVILKECKIGNAKSFCECVEIASKIPDGEQVYFLEDDYLMLNNQVLNLLNFNLYQLSKELGKKIAIMPDDYPDRYTGNSISTECRITETGHFLKIDKTTCTFATYSDVVKKNKKWLLKFINWPRLTENESINRVWKTVPLYQPIPAWTLHSQVKSVVPIYLDFEKVKDYFESRTLHS